MPSLDDEIDRQNREAAQAQAEAAARQRPAKYPRELTAVIHDFMRRKIPTDSRVSVGGRYPFLHLWLHLKNPNDKNCWTLFQDNGDGPGDSGRFMVLTEDGLLRTFVTGRGYQPIPEGWSGGPLRGTYMSLETGSLTREVTKALAAIVRNNG